MFKVDVYPNKNYLVSKVSGYMEVADITEMNQALMNAVRQLHPGFVMINDMTEMKAFSPEGVEEIKKFQAFLSGTKVKKVVRIVRSAIAKSQVNRVHREVGSYETIEVQSMEDALSIVEESIMS